jgi:predicted Zn-dependent protease
MKKLFTILSFSFFLAVGFTASAQYCGTANTNCGLPRQQPGFGALDSFPCIVQGVPTDISIAFKNYTNFTAQGNSITIYKLRMDTITNLPCGMCWSTTSPTNEFYAGNDGCIHIQGTTNDAVGEYKAHFILSVITTTDTSSYTNANSIEHIDANAGGVYLYFRVKSASGACAAVDTNVLGLRASCTIGINDITTSAVNGLTVQPNPMSSEAKVTFTSEINAAAQVKIVNIVGSEVYSATINAKAGMNETTISKGNLPAGIYILSVGNNHGTATRKFVISE